MRLDEPDNKGCVLGQSTTLTWLTASTPWEPRKKKSVHTVSYPYSDSLMKSVNKRNDSEGCNTVRDRDQVILSY